MLLTVIESNFIMDGNYKTFKSIFDFRLLIKYGWVFDLTPLDCVFG